MKTKEAYLNEFAQFPTLSEAVLTKLGQEWDDLVQSPEDFGNADNGVSGFIYYADTIEFAKQNIEQIHACYNYFTEEHMGHPWGKPADLDWLAKFALEHTIGEIINYLED